MKEIRDKKTRLSRTSLIKLKINFKDATSQRSINKIQENVYICVVRHKIIKQG